MEVFKEMKVGNKIQAYVCGYKFCQTNFNK